jgi:hypothetical protein
VKTFVDGCRHSRSRSGAGADFARDLRLDAQTACIDLTAPGRDQSIGDHFVELIGARGDCL